MIERRPLNADAPAFASRRRVEARLSNSPLRAMRVFARLGINLARLGKPWSVFAALHRVIEEYFRVYKNEGATAETVRCASERF